MEWDGCLRHSPRWHSQPLASVALVTYREVLTSWHIVINNYDEMCGSKEMGRNGLWLPNKTSISKYIISIEITIKNNKHHSEFSVLFLTFIYLWPIFDNATGSNSRSVHQSLAYDLGPLYFSVSRLFFF